MTDTWDESLETGNALIDSQHRELVHLIDALQETELDVHEALRVLDAIMEFTHVHFLSEEELMTEVRYPVDATNEMVEQHRQFKSYARLRVLEFRQGDAFSVLPLQASLDHFIKIHEFGLDRQLVDWIHRQGDQPRL